MNMDFIKSVIFVGVMLLVAFGLIWLGLDGIKHEMDIKRVEHLAQTAEIGSQRMLSASIYHEGRPVARYPITGTDSVIIRFANGDILSISNQWIGQEEVSVITRR